MALKAPKNPNYCATVVSIKNVVDLENCDNVKGSFIFGGQVIVSKETSVGDFGIYFPPETQLSSEFLSNNNLYRDKTLNKDPDKAGYFENNGRVRTVKFRGNKSVGFWIPINCLEFTGIQLTELKEGDEFDELKAIPICNKYVRKRNPLRKDDNARSRRRIRRQTKSRVIDNQFRFHETTNQFAKNAHRVSEGSTISITYKLHGTSVVISKVLCKKNIGIFSRALKFLGFKIIDTEYANLYASRKVIKNGLMSNLFNSYYKTDIWGKANDVIKEFLEDGMTVYAEVVGYLESGSYIQKPYDYGCEDGKFEVYVYRITYTNPSGRVFEFSAKQVQDWCRERGLKAVPELYYGRAVDLFRKITRKKWEKERVVTVLQEFYLEKDCMMCKNQVPAEGIVIRIEKNDFEAYKLKSTRFLEHETKMLDSGEEDIEEENPKEEDLE